MRPAGGIPTGLEGQVVAVHAEEVKGIEFDLVRTIPAPVEDVFGRLADIDGHNAWMPQKGSILRRTHQTSPGAPGAGTTYVDDTRFGPTPGEIIEYDPPTVIVFHWWDNASGRLKMEGWPGYALEAVDRGATLVRHHAKMEPYGIYRLATPVLRRIAVRERSTTMDALARSFEFIGRDPRD